MKGVLLFLCSIIAGAPAAAQLNSYYTLDDYSPAALREGREGQVTFELIVGVNGRATACRIVKSSGHSDLDATTCRIMVERTRFRPAIAENGNPAQDVFTGSVNWKIER